MPRVTWNKKSKSKEASPETEAEAQTGEDLAKGSSVEPTPPVETQKPTPEIKSPELETNTPIPETKTESQPGTVEFFDLKSQLDQPTEAKDFKKKEEETEKVEAKPNSDDFDGGIPNQEEPKPEETAAAEQQPESKYELSYEEQAKIVIGTLDAVGTLALPPAYKKKIFSKEELKKFTECNAFHILKESGSTAGKEIPEDLKEIYPKFKKYLKLAENVEFSPDESKSLIVPLAGVFEKYQIKAGPEISLIMAALMVMAPRLSPLFFE